MERGIFCQQANVDLEVKCDILATLIKGSNGTSDLVQTLFQVHLLPLPEHTIYVAVV